MHSRPISVCVRLPLAAVRDFGIPRSFLRRKGGGGSFLIFGTAARTTRAEPPRSPLRLGCFARCLPSEVICCTQCRPGCPPSRRCTQQLAPASEEAPEGCLPPSGQPYLRGIGHGGSGWVAHAAGEEGSTNFPVRFSVEKTPAANTRCRQYDATGNDLYLYPAKETVKL